ncbi:hypothetical protein [Sphingomonas sp. PB2P19]|uniref:hypothetical protein n=1 Tax=Sphingomonas rhamnosi TaxID=3096156 RepID=UPI002FC5C9F2
MQTTMPIPANLTHSQLEQPLVNLLKDMVAQAHHAGGRRLFGSPELSTAGS